MPSSQNKNVDSNSEHADQTEFVLDGRKWREFSDALDRPAKRIPELERLLCEPSVLERE